MAKKKSVKTGKSTQTKTTKAAKAKTTKAVKTVSKLSKADKKATKPTARSASKSMPKASAKATSQIAVKGAEKPTLKLVKSKSSTAFAFQPLDDRILVERAGESNMTPGGLYIPDTVSERPTKGVVKAVGRGHQDKNGRVQPLDVKIGDTVLFTNYAGTEVEFGGETYLILRETDLLGVSAD